MNQQSVLIVEPDILIRHPLAEYLRECGYRVLEAANSAEARQVFSDRSHDIEIVLADVDISDENGFVLASWIRENWPGVDVMLAGSVAKATEKASHICADGPAVSKPYDHQFVLDKIRRLLAARRRGQPEADPPC